jgi:hypothetical protein
MKFARIFHGRQLMKKSLFLLALFPLLIGCSKLLDKFSRNSESGTKVTFTTKNASLLTATMAGGIMVYAERNEDFYRASVKMDDEDDFSATLTLPNGSYDFTAVGWATAGLTGNPKCGFNIQPSGAVVLGGNPVTVTIDITTANCANNFYGSEPVYRTGSSFNSFDLKFCDAGVDVSGYSGSQNCDQTRESVRFIKGRTTSGIGAGGEGYPDPTTNRMVFIGDPYSSSRKELFSVNLNGTGTKRESGQSTQGSFNVLALDKAANSAKVAFIANKDNASYEIFISDLGSGNPTKISGSMTSPGTAYGVKKMKVNSTGTHILFVGDMDTTGIFEVYSVNISTGTRVKLNPTVSSGTGVKDASGYWLMEVSPDGNSVAWVASESSATIKALYSASVTGAAGSGVKLSGGSPQATFEVFDFVFTYNSAKMVWSGNYAAAGSRELFVADTNSGNSSQQISVSSTGSGVNSRPFVSKDSLVVVYSGDTTALPTQFSIYSADLSVASPFNRTKIHTAGVSGTFIYNLKFNSDNTKVAYYSDAPAAGTYKIFSATIGSADSHVDRSHASAATLPYQTGGGGGQDDPIQITSDGRVFYKGGVTGTPNDHGVYEFSLSNGAAATLVSQAHAANRVVPTFSLGLGKLFFPFDLTTDDVNKLFYFTPGSAPITEIPVIGSLLSSVKGVFIPRAGETLSSYPNGIALGGYAPGSSLEDMYFIPDYTNSSGLTKLSHIYNQASGSGKFQIHFLEYTSDPSGNLISFSPAISSQCLNGPSTDGQAKSLLSDSILFPAGDGSNDSPFAVAIDIYPLATNCSGTPQRILLPNGIAAPNTSSSASKLRLTDMGSTPVLFIKD